MPSTIRCIYCVLETICQSKNNQWLFIIVIIIIWYMDVALCIWKCIIMVQLKKKIQGNLDILLRKIPAKCVCFIYRLNFGYLTRLVNVTHVTAIFLNLNYFFNNSQPNTENKVDGYNYIIYRCLFSYCITDTSNTAASIFLNICS